MDIIHKKTLYVRAGKSAIIKNEESIQKSKNKAQSPVQNILPLCFLPFKIILKECNAFINE